MSFKKAVLLFSLFIFSFTGFSQSSSEIRLYYGISDAALLSSDEIDGRGSYEVKSFDELGIRFLKEISPNWSLEMGVNYATAEIENIFLFLESPVIGLVLLTNKSWKLSLFPS